MGKIFTLTLGTCALLSASLWGQRDWPGYSGDPGGRRFSALTQINTKNVSRLKLAWQYGIDPEAEAFVRGIPRTEAVPIVADGILYTPTRNRTIAALEPETGKEVWKFDLGQAAAPLRGVAYWPGDRQSPAQIFAAAADGRLLAIHAKTGKLVPGFGVEGVVNLRAGVTEKFPRMPYIVSTPGVIYKDLIITGVRGMEDDPDGPTMTIRGWNLRTGKLAWTFHTLPRPGETGYETWPKDYWINAGSPAPWGAATVDKQRGLVFFPIGQPAPQYYGGSRPGANLHSSSIVALEAATGKLRWSFQMTHHDLWDYDAEAAPALMEITNAGGKIPVVVAVSKAGMMYFLHRDTGKPVYPVEERPVPQSDVPGEHSWPTQPFPVKPPPLSRLSIRPDEVFAGEPAHEKFCKDLVEKIGGVHNLGPYTSYSNKEFRIIFPGQQGGPNYGGVAVDPMLGYVFVNSRDLGGMGRLDKSAPGDPVAYRRYSPLGAGTYYARFWNPETQLPCQRPPWAHLIAVNANTGEFAWKVPLGANGLLEAKGIHDTGAFGQGGPIATAGGLVFIAGTNDARFRAFDSRSGKKLWEAKLGTEGHTNPMTYMGRNGKQYIAIVSTGVSAFALE